MTRHGARHGAPTTDDGRRRLAQVVAGPPTTSGGRLREGVVAAASPLTVYIAGSTRAVPATALDSYSPFAGDFVALLVDAGDAVVLGSIGGLAVPVGGVEFQKATGSLSGVISSSLATGEHTGSDTVVTLPTGWGSMDVKIDGELAYTVDASTTALVRAQIYDTTDAAGLSPTQSYTRHNPRASASAWANEERAIETGWTAAHTIRFRSADALNTSPDATAYRFYIEKRRAS